MGPYNMTTQQLFKIRDALNVLCGLGYAQYPMRSDWELHRISSEINLRASKQGERYAKRNSNHQKTEAECT